MSYFADLSIYTYSKGFIHPKTYNIGWLDNKNLYPTGNTSDTFIDCLFEICCSPVAQTRGWHSCPFCDEYPVEIHKNNQTLVLGSAEIMVQGREIVYMAPNLIGHYVDAHKYCPPTDFIDAVVE